MFNIYKILLLAMKKVWMVKSYSSSNSHSKKIPQQNFLFPLSLEEFSPTS